MRQVEGWFPAGDANYPNGSRSYRNHNPLNLRASPHAIHILDGYAVFLTDIDGWAAARWDITQKATGNTRTGLGPKSTIVDLIRIWAPPGDSNDTQWYISQVLTGTGFEETMTLSELAAS